MNISDKIQATVRNVPDFPKPGINFKDISPIVENPTLSKEIVKEFAAQLEGKNIDAIVGVESRGFIYGMPLALELNIPFVLVRKVGKLPFTTIKYSYDLEYGSATVEMHIDSIKKDWNVFVHDDLLATGGTAIAAAELVKQQGGKIAGFGFIVELSFLGGAKKLEGYSNNIINLTTY